MMKSRVWLVITLSGLLAALIAGCGPKPDQTQMPMMNKGMTKAPAPAAEKQSIRQAGSNTLVQVARAWQQAFNVTHPDVQIAVSGEGTGTGFTALIDGSAEIADASRKIKDKELEQAKAKGVTPVEHLVAYDGIAVIVHKDNPLTELSVEKLSDIYTGKSPDWDALGAAGLGKIQVFARDSASGTFESFKELVVQLHGKAKERDYAASVLNQPSTQAIMQSVAQTKGGIGYVGLGYVDESVKVLAVIPAGGGKGVLPSAETVRDKSYPVARDLYCYTSGEPTGIIKEYLDWIKGPEGQDIVSREGFVPLS